MVGYYLKKKYCLHKDADQRSASYARSVKAFYILDRLKMSSFLAKKLDIFVLLGISNYHENH
tara:strand:- start:1661 stop:1846 length:186 start_codon:yes stop_codon:yes gene_type:complete